MMKYALLSAPCVQHVFPRFWYYMVTWVAACRSHHSLPYHLSLALAQSSSNGWTSLLQIAFFTPNIWKLLFLTLKQCLFLLQMTACLCPQRQITFWKSFITSPPPIRSCPIIIKGCISLLQIECLTPNIWHLLFWTFKPCLFYCKQQLAYVDKDR